MSSTRKKIFWLAVAVFILINQIHVVLVAENEPVRSRADTIGTITDTLRHLTVGKHPIVIQEWEVFKQSTLNIFISSKEHNENKPDKSIAPTGESTTQNNWPSSAFGTGPLSKFDLKHTWKIDPKNKQSHFDVLMNDKVFAKRYLVEMSLNIYYGDILFIRFNVGKWLKAISQDLRQITIINSDRETLMKDLDKNIVVARENPIPATDIHPTKGEYTFTHIRFRYDEKNKVVVAEALESKATIYLGFNVQKNTIDHLEKPSKLPDNPVYSEVTRFTTDELNHIAETTRAVWVAMNERPPRYQTVSIDTNHPDYIHQRAAHGGDLELIIKSEWSPPETGPVNSESSNSEINAEPPESTPTRAEPPHSEHTNFEPPKSNSPNAEPPISKEEPGVCRAPGARRRKRSLIGKESCAIIINSKSGEIEELNTDKFVDEYEKATEAVRRRLAEMASQIHPDGIKQSDVVNEERMKSLICFEEIKKQMHNLDIIKENLHTEAEPTEQIEKLKKIVENSKVRLSPTEMTTLLLCSNGIKTFTRWADGVAVPLGHFFLAKTIISGFVHKEYTTLAILGFRLSLDYADTGIKIVGPRIFEAASKSGKTLELIGKYAGPFGYAIDIGFVAYSLINSIGRLKNANNAYDRDDAIADVVTDSVNLVVTLTVLASIVYFPPAAIIGFVIFVISQAITSLFHTTNEVAKINSEIPLSTLEKIEVFESRLFDFFGTRNPDYIDFLVREKHANDLAVQMNLKFLRENENIRGIFFPSRTFNYTGSCKLTRSQCQFSLFGCWRWSSDTVLGSGCDRKRRCPDILCTDWNDGWDRQRCMCSSEAKLSFGEVELNQYVDLREQAYVYHDRAIPEDVKGADFICKPGFSSYVNHKVSQETTMLDYKCKNAIGIMQPQSKKKEGQFMFFNLGNGTDTVYPSVLEQTPNIFEMGDWGVKHFLCNHSTQRNEFIFNGECSLEHRGRLFGGKANNDAISVMETCGRYHRLKVDFDSGYMDMNTFYPDFIWTVANIEEFNGRKFECDEVNVACDTKRIASNGGRADEPDFISIVPSKECHYNLTIDVGAHTTVLSKARHGEITYLLGNETDNISIFVDVHTNSTPKHNFLFHHFSSKDITHFEIKHGLKESSIDLSLSRQATAKLTFHNKTNFANETVVPPVFFSESPLGSPQTILIPGNDNNSVLYHVLRGDFSSADNIRTGCSIIPNIMVLQSSKWAKLVGGNQSDEFILHRPVSEIHGMEGEDSVRLHSNLTLAVELDLTSGNYTGIENVLGSVGKNLSVTAACDTKLIVNPGGNSSVSSANVRIPKGLICQQRQLQIFTSGSSSVSVSSPISTPLNDSVTLIVSASTPSTPFEEQQPLQFHFTALTNETAGLFIALILEHKNWTVANNTEIRNGVIKIEMLGMGKFREKIRLEFQLPKDAPREKYVTSIPAIELVQDDHSNQTTKEPVARLLLQSDNGRPSAYFILGENATKFYGYPHIPNLFQIMNSSWNVIGGEKNDQFFAQTSNFKNVVIDGAGGINTLIISDECRNENTSTSPKTFMVHLGKGKFGFLQSPDADKGLLSNIHGVIGRRNNPDIIFADCSTSYLNGLGGIDDNLRDDIYNTGLRCDRDNLQHITITVPNFTNVKNSAAKGQFTYIIHSVDTSTIELNITNDNIHNLYFPFHSWDVVTKIAFDTSSNKIGLKFKEHTGLSNKSIDLFYDMKRFNSTQDYTNPTFRFQRQDSSEDAITSIEVNKDGVVAATHLILRGGPSLNARFHGLSLDLNRFLINVTETSKNPLGGIIGSNDSSANQFWLFNLKTPLKLIDGGKCKNCTNYLHLEQSFQTGQQIVADLSHGGFLATSEMELIETLKNIHAFYGRNSTDKDKVVVSSCTKSVSEVEEVIVEYSDGQDPFKLVIVLGSNTTVWFRDTPDFNRSIYDGRQDIFNYVFLSPRSFDPDGDEEFVTYLTAPSHNYYFQFTLDEVESINFDKEEEVLCFSIQQHSEQLCHTMLKSLNIFDQFYSQPSMLTNDGFRIQISRYGDTFISMGASSSFPSQEIIESTIIPLYEHTSSRLDATIILQTDKDYLHVGHDNGTSSQNVLQSVRFATSHLVGAGAHNAIYVLSSLEKDVYLYPGLTDDKLDGEKIETWRQTVDLSHVVMDIRMNVGIKYVPVVSGIGKNLIISMTPFELMHPGKVTIVNGTRDHIWRSMQVLLYQTMMEFRYDNVKNEFRLHPTPINVPDGYVYQVAPEDLENNHEIVYNHGSTENVITKFLIARNDSDLLVSNIANRSRPANVAGSSIGLSITTFVISTFFNEKGWVPKDTSTNRSNEAVHFLSIPSKISGVTLKFPGLNLELNGTKVNQLSQYGDSTSESEPDLHQVVVEEWQNVINQARGNLKHIPPTRVSKNSTRSNGFFLGQWSKIPRQMGSLPPHSLPNCGQYPSESTVDQSTSGVECRSVEGFPSSVRKSPSEITCRTGLSRVTINK